jgi:hypothetical protein
MKIVTNWLGILKHAWSIRLIILAGVLTGLEALVPDLPSFLDLTDRQFSAINFAVVTGAFVARLVAQKKVTDNGES